MGTRCSDDVIIPDVMLCERYVRLNTRVKGRESSREVEKHCESSFVMGLRVTNRLLTWRSIFSRRISSTAMRCTF